MTSSPHSISAPFRLGRLDRVPVPARGPNRLPPGALSGHTTAHLRRSPSPLLSHDSVPISYRVRREVRPNPPTRCFSRIVSCPMESRRSVRHVRSFGNTEACRTHFVEKRGEEKDFFESAAVSCVENRVVPLHLCIEMSALKRQWLWT